MRELAVNATKTEPTIQLTKYPLSPLGKAALWLRLKRYHFEHLVPSHLRDPVMACFGGQDAATPSFASRLVTEAGWTTPQLRRAIVGYR